MTLSDRTVLHLQQLVTAQPSPPKRYTLHEVIGQGGMGTVYRAHDEYLRRDVAFKVLDARSQLTPHANSRLLREAFILANLEHPGIVPVHDVGTLENGGGFYVMQLVKGDRLDDHAARGMSRGDVLRLMLRLSEIIAFANSRGVVHRDLKPGNIMIGPFGETLVLDWGVAKIISDAAYQIQRSNASELPKATASAPATVDGMVVGTRGYMSPEQESGASSRVDQRADVYSLGVIMRELLSTTGDTANRSLTAIVEKATAVQTTDRYPSASALGDDIRRWLDGRAVDAYREGPFEKTARFYRQHQTAVLLILTYLFVRVVILLWRRI